MDVRARARVRALTRIILILVAVQTLVGVAFWPSTHTERYRIPSESMAPALPVGARVTLDTAAYGGDDRPRLGDIVIFHPPEGALANECGVPPEPHRMCGVPKGPSYDVKFVKRVVGLPGDRLAIKDGALVRNGAPAREPYASLCSMACDFGRPIVIPPDHYFVLGDNRDGSDDSRFWGPVPSEAVLGRVDDCIALGWGCSPVR